MTQANSLIAPRVDTTNAWTGVWLAEDVQTLIDGVSSGSWIDSTIGGIGTSLDTLAVVVDPLGTLLQWAVAWLIEHVKPLTEALDWLAGDPAQITAYAQTWHNVASTLAGAAAPMRDAAGSSLGNWSGQAADSYRQQAAQQFSALDALARAAGGLGTITTVTGLVVSLVRSTVRDLIANFIATLLGRLPFWLAAEACTLGTATPLVVAQVSRAVAECAQSISRLLRALVTSVERLAPILRKLEELIGQITDVLRRLARREPLLSTPAGTAAASTATAAAAAAVGLNRRRPKVPRLRRGEPFTPNKRRPSLNQYKDLPPAAVDRHNGFRTNPDARIGVFKEPFPSRVPPPTGRNREYWDAYEEAVRVDHNGAPRLTYNAGGKERITDVGVIEATTEAGLGSRKLDQLWSDLVQHNRAALTVPQLTPAAERKLGQLAAIYEQLTGRRPLITVRETGP
jgi:hypothetical protein